MPESCIKLNDKVLTWIDIKAGHIRAVLNQNKFKNMG